MLNKQIGYKFGIAAAITLAIFTLPAYAGGGKETVLERYSHAGIGTESSTLGVTVARNAHDDGRAYVNLGDSRLYVHEGASLKHVYQGEDKPFSKKGSRGDSGPMVVRMSNGKESREVTVTQN